MKENNQKPKPLEGCLRAAVGITFLGIFALMSMATVRIDNVSSDKMFVNMLAGASIASGIIGTSILRGMTIPRFINEVGSEVLNMSAQGLIFYVIIELEKYYLIHH